MTMCYSVAAFYVWLICLITQHLLPYLSHHLLDESHCLCDALPETHDHYGVVTIICGGPDPGLRSLPQLLERGVLKNPGGGEGAQWSNSGCEVSITSSPVLTPPKSSQTLPPPTNNGLCPSSGPTDPPPPLQKCTKVYSTEAGDPQSSGLSSLKGHY